MMGKTDDIWSAWLRRRRFGGDDNYRNFALDQIKKLSSKIVEKAEIFESATVLDLGAGDGIVGLTALSKLGSGGKLILSDISEAALAIPMEIFNDKKIQAVQVEFLLAGVENLSSLPENSVDRVLLRAVLLYVENKQEAFKEMFRVLKPGGIAVLMEPINQRHTEFGIDLFRGYKLNEEPLLSIQPLLQNVVYELKRQNPTSLLGYNEHDLVHFSIGAGFKEIKLEYTLMRTSQANFVSWQAFFDTASNPLVPTLRESLSNILTSEEFDKVEMVLKEAVKQPAIRTTSEAILILKK